MKWLIRRYMEVMLQTMQELLLVMIWTMIWRGKGLSINENLSWTFILKWCLKWFMVKNQSCMKSVHRCARKSLKMDKYWEKFSHVDTFFMKNVLKYGFSKIKISFAQAAEETSWKKCHQFKISILRLFNEQFCFYLKI